MMLSRYQPSNNCVDPVGRVAALEQFGAGGYSVNVADRFHVEAGS